MKKPNFLYTTLLSGAKLLRFDCLEDLFYFDDIEVNPDGLGMENIDFYNDYFTNRFTLNTAKIEVLQNAQKEISMDEEFLRIIYRGKTSKRSFVKDKFIGNLSVPAYSSGSDKIFQRMMPGAKKQTLNMAFQVGILSCNYAENFKKILKTILVCQAMGISLNIDMYDSDTLAIDGCPSYVIVNVAKSCEKLDFRQLMACYHEEFFSVSLFNGYSGSGSQYQIGTFLPENSIIRDLADKYDILGGSMRSGIENEEMINKLLKIGLGNDWEDKFGNSDY